MPIIQSLVLTNQLPINTYSASVMTSGSLIADGLGNQLTSLKVTASYSTTASHFTPSIATISDVGPLTGSVSSSGFGFKTATEFNTFVTALSSSLQTLNTLISASRVAGIIS